MTSQPENNVSDNYLHRGPHPGPDYPFIPLSLSPAIELPGDPEPDVEITVRGTDGTRITVSIEDSTTERTRLIDAAALAADAATCRLAGGTRPPA